MNTRDEKTGELIFRVLKVGLACQSCQDLGLSAECTHMEQVRILCFFCCAPYIDIAHLRHFHSPLVPSTLEIRGKIQRREANIRTE